MNNLEKAWQVREFSLNLRCELILVRVKTLASRSLVKS